MRRDVSQDMTVLLQKLPQPERVPQFCQVVETEPLMRRTGAPLRSDLPFRQPVLSLSLLLDSRVLCDQQLNKRTQQRFASLADVVHKLEENQVQREFLL